MLCLSVGSVEVTRLLLEFGASPRKKNDIGKTACQLAGFVGILMSDLSGLIDLIFNCDFRISEMCNSYLQFYSSVKIGTVYSYSRYAKSYDTCDV